MEELLDIFADVEELPDAFKKSIPDNFRALLTALEKEFGCEMTIEIVYDMCPDCGWVYRDTATIQSASPDRDDCPMCSSPRYIMQQDGSCKPRMQVSLAALAGSAVG